MDNTTTLLCKTLNAYPYFGQEEFHAHRAEEVDTSSAKWMFLCFLSCLPKNKGLKLIHNMQM